MDKKSAMKTYDELFEKIIAFPNLLLASKKARKGKRYIQETSIFEINLEKELLKIKEELSDQTYKFGKYREFFIYEPKKRMISAAPYRDRVVHHALCNIIEPFFEKSFIFDSYANRKNKGTQKAILRAQKFLRKNKYVLKCDIKKYFASIDHTILKNIIRKKISCQKTLWLIDSIIDNSNMQEPSKDYFPGDNLFTPFERYKGLPIGNLTSQFFGNVYLDGFDHFIKEKLKCKYYLRYVNDFLIFSNSKDELNEIKMNIISYFYKLRLNLNDKKSIIYKTENGIKFLGHKIFDGFRLLIRDNIIRFKRRIKILEKNLKNNSISFEKYHLSIQSWVAHASFSDTFRLRNRLLAGTQYVKE